jgi:hypothetical protein
MITRPNNDHIVESDERQSCVSKCGNSFAWPDADDA